MHEPSPPADAVERKRILAAELSAHPFRPAWWLPGGHLQTLWAPLFRRAPRIAFQLEELETPDGDFLHLHRAGGEPDCPTVLFLHGLESSAAAGYVRGTVARLSRLGWSSAVMEFRGCSARMNRAARMYHSGETGDVDFAARRLRSAIGPAGRLYVVGFSLGGNVVGKWLGEQGPRAPVDGAAIVAAPFDLAASAAAVARSLGGLYSWYFTRTLLRKALAKSRQHPGRVNIDAARRARDLVAFDDAVTAPLHGFLSAQDYYAQSACGPYLQRIRVPTLLLSAEDDPYNPAHTLPRAAAADSPYLVDCFPRRGGHLGFVAGPPWKTRYWAEEQVVRFVVTLDGLVTRSESSGS